MARPEISSISPWPRGAVGRALSPCTRPVPLLGAGMSVPCGLPSGGELADWIRTLDLAVGVDFSSLPPRQERNPLWVSQQILSERPQARGELHRAVAEHFEEREASARPSPALLALARTPNQPSLILTLNYDRLVEIAAEEAGREVESLSMGDVHTLLNDGLAEPGDTLRVLHLHGRLGESPEDLVLDAKDYSARADEGWAATLFGAILPFYNLCIMGCSFEEQYLATVLQARRAEKARHVIVADEYLADRIFAGTSALSTQVHGLLVCDYPAGDHEVLNGLCERLVRCSPSPSGPPSVPVATAHSDDLYQARRFVDLGASQGHDNLELAIATEQLDVLGEDDLRAEHRAIVVGKPGAGKSQLLRNLAESPRAGERAVLVRLREVRDVVGPPESLLERWIAAGAVIDGGGPLAIDAVSTGSVRVHLLLDGLDELPPEQRVAAAEAATRISEALPEQRLTIASRPSGELDLLPASWRRLELLCDVQWRSDLLRKTGSSDAQLASRLGPLYPALEPLLRVPFFLRGMLGLLEGGEAPRDALDLTLTLLRSLSAEDPQLRAVGTALDRWLQRVALTMLLGGTATISRAELAELAADLGIGEAERVVDLLASRSLLHEAGQHYSFMHRLFGEALVAELLLGERPEDWLDVIAPEAAGHTFLRDDWAGVAELLLPHSARWREAVSGRDSRAAARSTPLDATREERLRAARALWARAQRLDVWIDPAGPPGARSDGELVSALLRAGDLPELEDEVRRALAADSRFRRGNAVDVIAGARLDDVEALLRRVLRDDPDTVVRRSAAIAARRCELTSLTGTLEAGALSATDEAEAEEMAAAALTLTPPDERIERATRLLAAGHPKIHDWDVAGELSAEEQLRWLAMRIREPEEEHWWARRQLGQIVPALSEPTPRQAAQVALVAAASGGGSREACEFLERHPEGAAGLVEAIDSNLIETYEITDLLLAAGPEALLRHGAPGSVLEDVETWQQARARPAATPERGEAAAAEPAPDLEEIASTADRAQLIGMLAAPRERWTRLAASANPEVRQQLVEAIDEAWGERDLREAVTLGTEQAWVSPWASAVLNFGPPLDLGLDRERWLQVALCGWLFAPQLEWLGRQAGAGWAQEALARDPSPISLGHLAELSQPDELPSVVQAIVTGEPGEPPRRSVEMTVAKLADSGRADLLRELASHDPLSERLALPRLAENGDVAAQRRQIEDLIESLRAGAQVERHEVEWLDAVVDASLSDLLAEALRSSARQMAPDDLAVNWVLTPIQAAFERADPTGAVAFYDELLAAPPWPGAQFMVENRDALLQRMLSEAGQRSAGEMGQRLGLPGGQV